MAGPFIGAVLRLGGAALLKKFLKKGVGDKTLGDAERKEVIRRLKRDAKNSRAAEARRKRDGVYKKKKLNKSQR